jgi:hypothetical protein
MRTVMKFEILPNEIMIKIFQHFSAFDLFNAFAELNFRFQQLIYNIPLSLDFQHINKIVFDQFCKRILLNPDMKSRIYSLQLSNAWDTSGQINAFLSLFSLEEFSELRSLTLIQPENNEIDRIVSMLPTLSNLYYFCCDEGCTGVKTMPTLALPNLRKLVINEYFADSLLTQNSTFVTHMTVSRCALGKINEIFRYAPLLKYFNARVYKRDFSSNNTLNLPNFPAVSLTYLNLRAENLEFNDIEYLFEQTPNLKTLILMEMSDNNYHKLGILFDAYRWENLITSFLPHLHTFKFHFQVLFIAEVQDLWYSGNIFVTHQSSWTRHQILSEFGKFQGNFWTGQHHWYTAIDLIREEANIFTVPYFCKCDYTLISDTELHCYHSLVDKLKLFDNVTNLRLSPNTAVKHSHLKFSNVTLLTLKEEEEEEEHFWSKYFYRPQAKINPTESLKIVGNLFKLKELHIAKDNRMKSPSILLEIFKEAPHLSSISIYPVTLLALLDDKELCKYFNKMITKLFFYHKESDWSISFDEYKRVWKVFSNIEQLICKIHRLENVVELLNHLPKLSSLHASSQTCFDENTELWLQNNLSNSDGNFYIKIYGRDLLLWISRHSTSLGGGPRENRIFSLIARIWGFADFLFDLIEG